MPILEASLIKQCLVASLEKGAPFPGSLNLSKSIFPPVYFPMPKFSENIFSKGPGINILGFMGHMCSVTVLQLSYDSMKVALDPVEQMTQISSSETSLSTSDSSLDLVNELWFAGSGPNL